MNPIIYRGLRFSKNLGRGCQGGWRVARCPHTFELPPPLSYILHLGNPCPSPRCSSIHKPPRRCQSMTFEKVRIVSLLTDS